MNKSEKALIGTLLLGVGAGASKLTYDHRGSIKRHMTKLGRKKARARKQLIHDTYRKIMPRLNGFGVQVDAHYYLNALRYVAHRYEFHIDHASKRLHIPHNRMYNLTIAFNRQHVLAHTLSNQYFVRQRVARNLIFAIKPYFHKYGRIDVKGYRRQIKSLIKDEVR